MELWERGPALAALDRLLAASASGGRVALLGAEAGLGKTAVVSEFARAAAPRARVLWGACDRLVTPRALGPLHDIGRLTGGRLAAALTANEPREAVYAAFLDELVTAHARRRPMVVVEDVHWADEATLDWLAFVGRRIERLPALLVVTYRDDEVGTEHPLRRTLAAFPAAVLDRVEVRPLSDDLVIEQARLAGRDPEGVRRLAAGNPLFLTELLKTDDGPVPVAVQNLVLDRIARLSGPARDLAHLVAVVRGRHHRGLVGGHQVGADAHRGHVGHTGHLPRWRQNAPQSSGRRKYRGASWTARSITG